MHLAVVHLWQCRRNGILMEHSENAKVVAFLSTASILANDEAQLYNVLLTVN